MEPEQIVIRPARPEDAPQPAYLMYLVEPAFGVTLFGGPESNVIRVLGELFPIPNHLNSFTHTFVAERNRQIVGLFLGFDKGTWETAERAMWREIGFRWFSIISPWYFLRSFLRIIGTIIDLARTSEPLLAGDYYIHMLAVLPEVRRQGVATRLMEFAVDQARSKGLKRVVLDVIVENEGARRFYERLGFQATQTVTDARFCRRFGIQGSIRMVKPITNSTEEVRHERE